MARMGPGGAVSGCASCAVSLLCSESVLCPCAMERAGDFRGALRQAKASGPSTPAQA